MAILNILIGLPLTLLMYIVKILQDSIPTLFEHFLKCITALLLFVVRGVVWFLQQCIKGLHRLFQGLDGK